MSDRTEGGSGLVEVLDRLVHRVALVTDHLSAFICAVLIVVTTAAMIIYQLGIAISWLDDLLRMLLLWLILLGTVPLCLYNDHISMDALYLRYPPAFRKVIDMFVAVLGVGLCAYVAKMGIDSLWQQLEYNALLPSGELPAWPQSLAVPVAFGLMAVAYLSYLVSLITGRRRQSTLGLL